MKSLGSSISFHVKFVGALFNDVGKLLIADADVNIGTPFVVIPIALCTSVLTTSGSLVLLPPL